MIIVRKAVNDMNLQTKKNDVLYTLCPNFISVSIDNIEQLYRYLIITYKEDTAYIIDLKTKETKEIKPTEKPEEEILPAEQPKTEDLKKEEED